MNDCSCKKKILYVETGMGFGGSAMSLLDLVSNLSEYAPVLVFYADENEGFLSYFNSFDVQYLNAKFTYKHANKFNKELNEFISNALLRKILYKGYVVASFINDILLKRKIIQVIREKQIDLLHANNCIDPVLIRAAKSCNIPCVVHLRGHVDCGGEKRKINDSMDLLISPTNKIARYAQDSLKVKEDKIIVLYDSIDASLFDCANDGGVIREKYDIAEDVIVIGMFARIIRMKGQHVLVNSVIKLLASNHDVVCMFVGDESDFADSYLQEFKEKIRESGYADKFIFAGYQANIAVYYQAVDIVVHPSVEDEAFGRIIIEAWASGKPIVASDIGASKELISDGIDGLITKTGDSLSLYEKLSCLIENEGLCSYLVENGRQRVKEKFDSRLVASRLESIYGSMLLSH